MHTQTAGTDWTRAWRTAAEAEQWGEATPLLRVVGLAILAAGLGTLAGTTLGMQLRPTVLQVATALVATALTLAVVPLAAHTTRTRAHLLVITAALLSAGAAAIHFAVIPAHFEEWWGFGAFFVFSGLAQLGWSLAVVTWPRRHLFWMGVIGNAAIVALWVVTRVEGTLVGPEPHEPEPIGIADGIATGFEIAIVVLAVTTALLGVPRRVTLNRLAWFAGVVALALTVLALLSAMAAAPGLIPAVE